MRRVGERFELLSRAGAGGMGEVWRARDHRTGELVALKRILGAADDTGRFERETRLLERVRHPALIAYVAHGADEDGRPYLVMAWVEGETLTQRIARAPLSVGDAITVVRRVAEALGALHEGGIVHRDVKPSNVMLPDGDPARAVLLDLGVARPKHATRALTAADCIVGTLGYMAPEQALAQETIDARTDVFALGCVLFECLADEPLYRAENARALLAQLLLDEPRRLRSVWPDAPDALDRLLASMLAREPRSRPRDGAAAARMIGELRWDELARPEAPTVRREGPLRAQSSSEQRFVLAAVVVVGEANGAADRTIAAASADAQVATLERAVREAGGRIARMDGSSALVIAAVRGTVADRVRAAATLVRFALDAIPGARASISAGLDATLAGAPVGEVLARATALSRDAAAGAIAIDTTVAELLGDRFEIQSGVLGEARRASGERATPLVGREKELAILEATLAEVLDEGAPRAVLLTAPPGAGKTRIGHELCARLSGREGVRILTAHSEVTTAGSPQLLARALLAEAAGISIKPTRAEASALREHVASLPALADPARVADFLCEMLGVPAEAPCFELEAARGDAELTRRWTRRCFREWLAGLSATRPTLLLLEDLQWSDELSVGHIGEALRTHGGGAGPLFVVALARPEVRDLFREPWPNTHQLTLSPLGARAAERLARAALGTDSTPENVARVRERGAGNPLFLEELARFVRDRRQGEMPATIAAVLHARLEELLDEQRLVLRAASVLGDRFVVNHVAAIAGQSPRAVEHVLASMGGRHLVERADDEWAFHHALVRETAYATLLEAEAQRAHGRAADWLEARGDPDPREMLRHVERTFDDARQAVWLVRTVKLLADAGNDTESWTLAERGLELPGLTSIQEGRLRVNAGAGRLLGGQDVAAALTHAARAVAVLPADDPDLPAAEALFAYSVLGAGDLEATRAALIRWTIASKGLRTRMDGVALRGMAGAAAALGMKDLVDQIFAKHPPGVAGLAHWVLIGAATACLHERGTMGRVRALGARALPEAFRAEDLMAIEFASFDAVDAWADLVRSSRAMAARASTVTPLQIAYAEIVRATMTGDDATLRAMVALPVAYIGEIARVRLIQVLLARKDEASLGEVEALLREPRRVDAPLMSPAIEGACAWTALRRGDAEKALRDVERGMALAEQVTSAWAWEQLHLVRVSALCHLGRLAQARDAARDAIGRLAITLEHADAFMLECLEEGAWWIHDLRRLCADLDMPFPPLEELARPRSPLMPER